MNANCHHKKRLHGSRGVALVITLLLLSLFTAMTLAMVIATTSDGLIDGFYRNFRGSFYASDSGLNAARQYLINQIQTAVPTSYVPSSGPPVLSTTQTQMLSNLNNTTTGFGAYQSIIGTQTSWTGKFKVDSTNTTLGAPTCTVTYSGIATPLPTCSTTGSASDTVTAYNYAYPYQIATIGQSGNSEQNKTVEVGVFNLQVLINPTSSTTTSFAAYGTLLDQYAICSGAFVPGTMSGQFFSNDSWNFGDSGNYIFTGNVGAVNSKVGYMHSNGHCDQSSATSDSNGTTIKPSFQGGLSLSQNGIPLPTDAFSQQKAVLDGVGACGAAGSGSTCTSPTQAQRAAVLRNVSLTQWPTTGAEPTTGVYLPYTSTTVAGVTTNTFAGGGIYVQGNADQVTMTAGTVTLPGPPIVTHRTQVFAIKQSSTTTTVTLDLDGNNTKITNGTTTTTIVGLPMDDSDGTPSEACMLYVNGNIQNTSNGTGLSGPSSGAAIQNNSAVTITATGTIDVTGNILYSTEPVTLNTADTLISGVTNVLGIYTPGGNIEIRPPSSMTTLEIDAAIATISSGGSGGITGTWNNVGTLTIVGGRTQNKALSGASIGARNIWFDQRYASGSFAPPWFPATTIISTATNTAVIEPVQANRISWLNQTAQ